MTQPKTNPNINAHAWTRLQCCILFLPLFSSGCIETESLWWPTKITRTSAELLYDDPTTFTHFHYKLQSQQINFIEWKPWDWQSGYGSKKHQFIPTERYIINNTNDALNVEFVVSHDNRNSTADLDTGIYAYLNCGNIKDNNTRDCTFKQCLEPLCDNEQIDYGGTLAQQYEFVFERRSKRLVFGGQDGSANDLITRDIDKDGVIAEDDCDDNNDAIYPGAEEIPGDGIDQDCDGSDMALPDEDGDGFDSSTDCDDSDASVYPGAEDIPGDGIDQDCDNTDAPHIDSDGDGFDTATDCDDTDASIYPGATDTPGDGIDQDCDTEDAPYPDEDGDQFTADEDCNDSDSSIYPGAVDIPGDGIDQDCDGADLPITDNDGDGISSDTDCNDSDSSVYPGAPEIPGDGIDQDCDGNDSADFCNDTCQFANDGVCDDGGTNSFFSACDLGTDCSDCGVRIDVDGDGYDADSDCDESDSSIFPGAPEIPGDGIDQNCDQYDGITCCYTLEMQDSYGDGWNDATVIFSNNVSSFIDTVEMLTGYSDSHETCPPEGSTLTMEFTSGDWDNEITLTLLSPSGATLFTETEPTAGVLYTTPVTCP